MIVTKQVLDKELTVKMLLEYINNGLKKGIIEENTRVLVYDNGKRDESFDPVECIELIPSGPDEYDYKHITWKKMKALQDKSKKSYVHSTRMKVRSDVASATIGIIKSNKVQFVGDESAKVKSCMVIANRA